MNTVLREEKKYLINYAEFRHLTHKLSQCLKEDSHNGVFGYRVRSLYFDSIYDSDFYDKLNGIENRRKIRLRIYDESDKLASLEIKQKQGANQLKRTLRIDKDDAIQLTKGNYTPLLSYHSDFAVECYELLNVKCYRPKTVVEYNRKAFITNENNIRITFDNNIVATETNFDIFDSKLNMYPVMDPFAVVMEVKYNGFLLEYIKRMINEANKSELSVSKYCLARQHGCLSRL